MTSDVQVFEKDKIKLNILQDVLGGLIKIGFQLNNGPAQDYASQIHVDGKRVNVYGMFNISEDAKEGDTITIRPIKIDAPLKILFHANANFSGKRANVIRGATKEVAQVFEINSETTMIELTPQGKQFYLLKVSNRGGIAAAPIQNTSPKPQRTPILNNNQNTVTESTPTQTSTLFEEINTPRQETSPVDDRFEGFGLDTGFTGGDNRFDSFDVDPAAVISKSSPKANLVPPEEITAGIQESIVPPANQDVYSSTPQQDDRDIQRIEQEISVIERQQEQLSIKKKSAKAHLDKIEAEYKKDYAAFEQELEEYISRMEADATIIEHYKDQDVMPIEIILKEVSLKLQEAEEQIRFFIEAKQRKTMEIENEIKSNKKQ